MSDSATQQLLINARPFQTRVALLEEAAGTALLCELHLVDPLRESSVGNLLCGRVQSILPGMQAAFVEVGLDRPGFLHASDIERRKTHSNEGEPTAPTDIRKLVHEGQILQVQVAKDPIANKGARLTTQVTLASRYLVLTPNSNQIGISQRLESEEERERLRGLVEQSAAEVGLAAQHGFIVRTVAEGVDTQALRDDMVYLKGLWEDIERGAKKARVGDVLHAELPVQVRVLRDLVNPKIERIQIDDAEIFHKARAYMAQHSPFYVDRIELHSGPDALFDSCGVEAQIEAAQGTHVRLPCGGYLIIEQTEAMITVDVNTGAYTGSQSLEETVFRTNMEAAEALPRQLRLRNLGGLVAIDFIDMADEAHQSKVVEALSNACALDPTPTRLQALSEFGILELSRKRTRESLYQQLSEPCDSCQGTGRTKKPGVVCFEIMRSIERLGEQSHEGNPVAGGCRVEYLLQANEAVVDRLTNSDAIQLAEVVERAGLIVSMRGESGFAADQFDLICLKEGRSPGE